MSDLAAGLRARLEAAEARGQKSAAELDAEATGKGLRTPLHRPEAYTHVHLTAEELRGLLAEDERMRAALEHIATTGERECARTCAGRLPGRHASDCPFEYYATAREALGR